MCWLLNEHDRVWIVLEQFDDEIITMRPRQRWEIENQFLILAKLCNYVINVPHIFDDLSRVIPQKLGIVLASRSWHHTNDLHREACLCTHQGVPVDACITGKCDPFLDSLALLKLWLIDPKPLLLEA